MYQVYPKAVAAVALKESGTTSQPAKAISGADDADPTRNSPEDHHRHRGSPPGRNLTLAWQGSHALGELRAEIAACFLTTEFGIPVTDRLENHSAYLDNWIKAMQGDHGLVFRISSAASKAADFLLSFSRKEVNEPTAA
jgi:hypothetical protein